VKVDASASSADAIKAMVRDGIPVWAQFGTDPAAAVKDQLVREAKTLEAAGASLLDFRHSGPVAGPEVVRAVDIPVIGGLGGGPWLDGRVRALVAAIGYLAAAVDDGTERYANVAQIALSAITAFSEDVRAARQIRGAAPAVRTA
jgi:3-methyl-2-oxobutanoate hydroxymethyltransferase